MSDGAIVGLIGGVVVGLVVRVSNMVCMWLARALKVTPPEPIASPIDHHGQTS